MTLLHALAISAAGIAAGCINAVVGSGTMITFPTLIALGYPPVVANVSNSVGLVPGSAAGAYGYLRELAGQRSRALRLGLASVVGAIGGGILLLALPAEAFRLIVPALIILSCVLVVAQPRLSQWLAGRRRNPHGGPMLWLGVLGTGVYGGYFGAAQGVILLALLGTFLDANLQRVNGIKNVLAMLVNATAAVLFILVSHVPAVADLFGAKARVDWPVAVAIAVGSTLGGFVGAFVGRRLPPVVFRIVIVVVGLIAVIKLL